MQYDFDDDLRGPEPRAFLEEARRLFSRRRSAQPCPPDELLHRAIMIVLSTATALLAAFIFYCFVWAAA